MSIQPAFGAALYERSGIEVFWERVPANPAEPPPVAAVEIDLWEYLVETIDLASTTATAGPDIGPA